MEKRRELDECILRWRWKKKWDWVEGNNEWTKERGKEKNEEWAEQEAVNQERDSGWRERWGQSDGERGRRFGQQQ